MISFNTIFFIITAISLSTAFLSGWSIVSYLEDEGKIKKNNTLRGLPWSSLVEYYKIQKQKNGNYGFVGITYIVSGVCTLLEGIVLLFTW